MTSSPAHNSLDYVEISVTDLAAVKSFYGAAFGWSFTDYGDAYVGFSHPGRDSEAGGFSLSHEIRTGGGPFVILYSADLEKTADLIASSGGVVSTPAYEFPGGRRLHFRDPSGNELGVWSAI